MVFLVLWGLSVPFAVVASEFLDRPIKVFRVAGFALGIPILGAAALVGGVRLGRRWGTVGLAAGVMVMVAGIAFTVGSSVDVYRMAAAEGASAARLDQIRATVSYLETVPEETPLVFLVSRRNPFLLDRLVRAGLPAGRALQAHLYWGGIDDLVAGRPGAQQEDSRSARVGRAWWHRWWRDADAILRAEPAVFYLGTLNPLLGPPAGASELAPGVLLVRGPAPPSPQSDSAPLGTTWPATIGASVGMLLVLGSVGSGWARWLLPVAGLEWLGLSPAVGIGVLTLVGTVLGRVGVPLGGAGGVVIVLGLAGVGWLPRSMRRGVPSGKHAPRVEGSHGIAGR
jgi:hypothetical protein